MTEKHTYLRRYKMENPVCKPSSNPQLTLYLIIIFVFLFLRPSKYCGIDFHYSIGNVSNT